VIGEEGGIASTVGEFYDVTVREKLPQDISRFHAIVLKKQVGEESLKPYITDGNGLVFTGDGKMDVSPIRKASIDTETQTPEIVIGIDSSEGALEGTRGWGSCEVGDSIKDSKILAENVVGSLAQERPASIVGVFSYNNSVFSFGAPKALTYTSYRNKLIGSRGIASIPVCGTSYHVNALRQASDMIGESPGNIILITDGQPPPDGGVYSPDSRERVSSGVSEKQYKNRAIEVARRLGTKLSLSVVGVGDYSGHEDFLEELANAGGGEFYASKQEFFNLEKRLQGGGGNAQKSVTVADDDQFITRGLDGLSYSTSNLDE
jgi:hypothetical protein